MTDAPARTALEDIWLTNTVRGQLGREAGLPTGMAVQAVNSICRKVMSVRGFPGTPAEFHRAKLQARGGLEPRSINAADFVAIVDLGFDQIHRVAPWQQYGPKRHDACVALAKVLKRKYA